MNILKLSVMLLGKLGHIQVKHADISNVEKFQEFNTSKRNQEAELRRYPDLQLRRQGKGEANGLEGGVWDQTLSVLDPVLEGKCFCSLFVR